MIPLENLFNNDVLGRYFFPYLFAFNNLSLSHFRKFREKDDMLPYQKVNHIFENPDKTGIGLRYKFFSYSIVQIIPEKVKYFMVTERFFLGTIRTGCGTHPDNFSIGGSFNIRHIVLPENMLRQQ